jgi:hypothetical protein
VVRPDNPGRGAEVERRADRLVGSEGATDRTDAARGAHARSHGADSAVSEVANEPVEPSKLGSDVGIHEGDQ